MTIELHHRLVRIIDAILRRRLPSWARRLLERVADRSLVRIVDLCRRRARA